MSRNMGLADAGHSVSLQPMKCPLALCTVAVALVSLAPVRAFAQQPSKKEVLAAELLDELHIQKMMDSAFDSVPKMQEQMMASQKMPPAQIAKFHQRLQASMESTKKLMGWDTIKPMFVKIYADNFDEGDLAGLIAFYKTPVGQKFIQQQPQIQAATMQAMSQIMPKIQAAVMESLKGVDEDASTSTP